MKYVIAPPNIPEFLYKSSAMAWLHLIIWSKKEYAARLRYCAKHGYRDQWLWLHENSSAIHVLASLPMFRKLCSVMTETVWNLFSRSDRRFFQSSYELGNLLAR